MIERIQLQSPHLLWLALTALMGGIVAIAWFYRPQVRSLIAPASWILPLLRALALGVLGISLLGPTLLTPLDPQDRGAIAILVDESRSMGVVDMQRSPAELVQLASAMRALPDGIRSPELGDLKRQLADLGQYVDEVARARSELEYARLAGRGIESAGAHLRESRAEMATALKSIVVSAPTGFSDAISRIGGESAADQLARIIDQIDAVQSFTDAELYRTNDLVRTVCDELASQPRIELVSRALEGDAGLVARLEVDGPVRVFGFSDSLKALAPFEGELNASGNRTNLVKSLNELRPQMGNSRITGAIIFSDGRQVGHVPAAGEGNWGDIPTWGIMTAGPVSRDLAIERATVPTSAFVGETIIVRGDISGIGLNGTVAQLTVQAGAVRSSVSAMIQNGIAHVEVPIKFENPGPQALTITLDAQEGEATAVNNRVRRIVKVISERTRVALIGGASTEDYKALQNALSSAAGIMLTERLVTAGQCDLSTEQLLNQDLLVLDELPLNALDAQQWDAINRLAVERGKNVLIIANNPAIAAGYASHPLAGAFLPWRGDTQPVRRVSPVDEMVFYVVPSTLEAGSDRGQWSDLSAVSRFLAFPQLKSGVNAVWIERDSKSPVLTEMKAGAGRMMFLGLDEIWRWHNPAQVWLDLIHHAAPQPGTTDGQQAVADEEDEMRNISGDADELRKLIGGQGELLTMADLPSLPRRLERLRQSQPRFAELRLWDSPYLFVFVVTCLMAEWALRKEVGLA